METLREILMHSDEEDLQILIEYQKNDKRFKGLDKYAKVSAIIDEIRANGTNTFQNILLKKNEYDSIVRDVAKQLKVTYNKDATTDIIETEIVIKLISDEFKTMSVDQQKEILENLGIDNVSSILASPGLLAGILAAKLSGFAIYRLTAIAANAIAKAILGKGLTFVANAALMRGIGIALGPVGWGVSAAWFAFDLAGPNFKKTIPSIVHIALLRQKYRENKNLKCPNCQSPIPLDAKFCMECGTKIEKTTDSDINFILTR